MSRNLTGLPEHPLPSGYRLRLMNPVDVKHWVAVQQAAEPFLTMSEKWFWQEFGKPAGLAWERCFLLQIDEGTPVGTITAWTDSAWDGQVRGRIHWLAVRPEWQGRGFAKPMVSMALELLRQFHDSVYLMTQPERLVAIRLYLGLGFEPVIRGDDECGVWRGVRGQLRGSE